GTTAQREMSSFSIDRPPAGGERCLGQDAMTGTTDEFRWTDGSTVLKNANGLTTTRTTTADPRFGMLSPIESITYTTPGGRRGQVTRTRGAVLSDRTNPLSLTSLTDTVSRNGRTQTDVYTSADHKITSTSPGGKVTT